MSHRHKIVATAALLALAALVPGCQTPTAQPARAVMPTPVESIVGMDPCAERLHDLCEQFLLYYVSHRQLPPHLADLDKAGSRPAPPPACPTSGKPYVYNPEGLAVAGHPGRLIVYDATPCHGGMRWGIMAGTPRPGHPLVLGVLRLPDSAIAWPEFKSGVDRRSE